MTAYTNGDIISLAGALDQRLMNPGTRVVLSTRCPAHHGEIKAYRLGVGRSLVILDAGGLKWVRPEYLTLEKQA